MIVVLVKWKIRPGREQEFVQHWQKLTVGDRRALVGEFLCRPQYRDYAIWGLPEVDDPPCEVFVNVGFWTDESVFLSEIAP